MDILIYTSSQSTSGQRLRKRLAGLDSLKTLKECWNYNELLKQFNTPEPLPDTVVLSADSRQELESFFQFQSRLDQVFFILVLPDAQQQTVARGHQLRPRFVTYSDSDFGEIEAILSRLAVNRQDQTHRD